jgi:HEAT repeat protein
MGDAVEEAEKLPLAERLDHSNWKVRQSAYEALEKKFQEADDGVASVFKEFGNYSGFCGINIELLIYYVNLFRAVYEKDFERQKCSLVRKGFGCRNCMG